MKEFSRFSRVKYFATRK